MHLRMEMGMEKLQKSLFIGLIKTIISAKWEEALHKEVVQFNESANLIEKSKQKSVKKCLVGWLRKLVTTL
jgi:ubiquinone biosynthesis protein Coq4